MAVTVATLKAVIGLDNSQFKQGATETKKDVRELGSEIQTVAGFLTGLGAALTATVSVPIVLVGKQSLDAAVQMDSFTRSLNATTGSAAETDRELRDLREVAKLPGLGFKEAVQGSVRLQAAGQSAEEAKNELLAFGNAIAQVGKGKHELEIVGDELTRLASQSRVSGRSVMELSRQVPQLRTIMKKAFGTADSMELEKLGVDSKRFLAVITTELLKIPKVTGGAANAFENLDDAMFQLNAALGKSLLPTVLPVMVKLAETTDYLAGIWVALPYPIQLANVALAGFFALVGPGLIIFGQLSFAVMNIGKAYAAYTAIQTANTAATVANAEAQTADAVASQTNGQAIKGLIGLFAVETTACTTATGAVISNAIAVTSLGSAAKLALPLVMSFLAGWTIGTAINDKFIGTIDRQAQSTEDATTAMRKSIPYLDEAIRARQKFAAVEKDIAASGRSDLRNSSRYQELKKEADDLTAKYQAAAADMGHGFDATAAKAKAAADEIKESFTKAIDDATKKLAELKAPNLEAKLRVDYPGISDPEIKKLALIEKQVEAAQKLHDAQKKSNDEQARSLEEFRKQIEDARKQVAGLQAPNTLERVRIAAPKGATDAQIRELAALKDQTEALEKAKDKRDDEKRKIEELQTQLGKLNGTLAVSATSVQTFAAQVSSGATSGSSNRAITTGGGRWQDEVKAIAKQFGLAITSGFRPGARTHATGSPSLHSTGTAQYPGAFDVSGGKSQMASFFTYMKTNFASSIREMLYSPLGQVHRGASSPEIRNPVTRADHYSHVHIGMEDGQTKTNAAVAASVPLLKAATVAQTALTAAQKDAANLAAGIGADAAQRLVSNTIELKQNLALLTATTDRDRVAVELTGRSYDKLNAAQKALVGQNLALRQSIQKAEDFKRLGEAWNDQRVGLLKAKAATEEERIALDLFKRTFVTLSPEFQKRIREMADMKKQTEELTKATEDAKQRHEAIVGALADARGGFLEAGAATDKERIALGFFKNRMKDLPEGVSTAQQALIYFRDELGLNVTEAEKAAAKIAELTQSTKELAREQAWKTSLTDARAKLLDVFSASEQERIALGFFKDRIGELPAGVNTAGAALDYFEKTLRLNVQGAKDAAAGIVGYQDRLKTTGDMGKSMADSLMSTLKSIEEWGKRVEAARKRYEQFQFDLSQRRDTAQARLTPTVDPAQIAWLEFLQRNDKLAKDLEGDTKKAAAAFEDFKRTMQVEREAGLMDELRQKSKETATELQGLRDGTDRYKAILRDLGVNVNEVTSGMDSLVQSIIKNEREIERMQKMKDEITQVATDVSDVFKNALGDLFEHGFGSFFTDVVTGFRQMLQRMVAEWIASQIQKLILNSLLSLAGGLGGGGGGASGGSSFLGDFDGSGFGNVAAKGGYVEAGQRTLVGETGPEVFVPSSSGRILPNEGSGKSVHLTQNFHITTPDANSFRKSQSQILSDAKRNMDRVQRRNG